MRQKREAVLCFEFNMPKGPKPVLEYCEDYVAISQVLDANPEILDAIHEDVKKLSEGGRRGRRGDFTSENILRALIVQSVEGLSLRKTVVKIGTTPFLQDFLRLRKKAAMDHGFLDKCRLATRPATQRKINEILAQYAIRLGAVDPTVIEGTISVLKRAFRLSHCFFEGFKGFVSAVGWGVFSHNLRILARQDTRYTRRSSNLQSDYLFFGFMSFYF